MRAKKPSLKFVLLLIAGILALIGYFVFFSGRSYECTNLGDCISYEFETLSGLANGSFSTPGLASRGFNPTELPPYDIGKKIRKISLNSEWIEPLFLLKLDKPVTSNVGDQIYNDRQPLPILVCLVVDNAGSDVWNDLSVIQYHDKTLLLLIDGYAYQINNSQAFVNFFDRSQEVLPPEDAARFFWWAS